MKARDLALLFVLGAMWGSSFLFIKVALSEVSPAFIVGGRLFFALLSLLVALPLLARLSGPTPEPSGGEGSVPARALRLWRPLLVLGVVSAVLPYFVISWGTQFLPSGTAAILNSTVPLFSATLAALLAIGDEKLGPQGLLGVLLGMAGVGVLAGGSFGLGDEALLALLGVGAVLLGSLSYAVGGLFARRALAGVPVAVSALGQNAAGLLVALPFAAASVPPEMPGFLTLGSVAALGAIGTGFSLLIFYKLLANIGATRASTVTYLVPLWALLYGAAFLGEALTLRAILGLLLILAGVAAISGLRLPTKRPPTAAP